MIRENQKRKTTFKFVRVNGTGTVLTTKGYRDVFVYGCLLFDRWSFIVHQDILDPEFVAVSEASTGYGLKNESYHSVKDALHFATSIIYEKRYYLATSIGDALVKTRCNLFGRNTTNLQTLAIDTVLWL